MAKTIIHKLAHGRGDQKKANNGAFEQGVKWSVSCSKKERKQTYACCSFYYRIWIYTSQYFNALTSVQPTCTDPLCNFYNFSFVLLQCRLLALYLEDEQNINYLSTNILETNL